MEGEPEASIACLSMHRQRLTRASPAPAQDILLEALKGALVLAVLERLYVTRNSQWVRG
jgi:hypothetical protein